MSDETKIEIADAMQVNAIQNSMLRTNSTLRDDEWKRFDSELLAIARQRLTAVSDLQAAGLTQDLGGLGTVVSLIETSSDLTPARVSIDGETRSDDDRVEFGLLGYPVPIFRKDFKIGARQLASSLSGNGSAGSTQGLDVTQMAIAARRVTDSMESMVFNGVPSLGAVDGYNLYGYTNHPNRLTQTLTGSWATATGDNILSDTLAMLDQLYSVNRYGPFYMYVAKNIWANIQNDYDSSNSSNRTTKDRIEALADVQVVRPGDSLADNTVVLVQMTRENVDLGVAQDLVNVELSSNGDLLAPKKFMVFSSCALRLKTDANGSLGVCVGLPA